MKKNSDIELFLNYLEKSPTPFHAVENASRILFENGFEFLSLADEWKLMPEGKYFLTLNGTSLFAFINSKKSGAEEFRLIGSHTDSPCIKIKPNPEFIKEGFLQLNTEVYGGPLLSTWFDRPLSLAGRVFLKGEDAYSPIQKTIDFREPVALIPNLAIHMNREVNNGYAINNQKDLIPILASGIKDGADFSSCILKMVSEKLDVLVEDILDMELSLYDNLKPSLIGLHKDMISSARIDNLQAVFSGLQALIASEAGENSIKMIACYDNEEVGNATKQGADSIFLYTVIQRILEAKGSYSISNCSRAIASSFMISVDGAHSVNPNKTEKYDPVNKPQLNRGPVLKISSNQRYSTDAQSSSVLKLLAMSAGVPLQVFVNNSNEKGGSTIGPTAGKYLAMSSADIGVPMLAMHSIREATGIHDHIWMVNLLKEFFK